ncbi:MAG: glycosyltransferase family 39 protein [Patescibacteria group bacterium]
MTTSKIAQHEWKLIAFIVLVAFVVRLYRINYPLADWHSWRQSDTASVTREYLKHGIDLLHPTYQDLSTIPNNLNNAQHGYRMVEFPFINAFTAVVLKVIPVLPLVPTSRFLSNLVSLGTLLSLYFLVRNLSGKRVAVVTAIMFAVLPYSVYYSRTILPEPYMLFFSTFSLLGFSNWLSTKNLKWLLVSAVGLSLALLLKPFVAFLAPVYLGLILFQFKTIKDVQKFLSAQFFLGLISYALIAFIPLYYWRKWIAQYPEGIPALTWLFNSNGIRFRPAWFRWLGYERLTKMFLGYIGILFLPLAFVRISRDKVVYLFWWLSIALFFSVIATGNVQHDYYQNLMTPIVCISISLGSWELLKILTNLLSSQKIALGIVVSLNVGMLLLAWQQLKGNFNVNHWDYVEAGQVVDRLTPTDAKVIAPADGDTYFLFQTNRTGWPIGVDIEDKIQKGATIYVSTNYDDEAHDLENRYTVIEKTPVYIIIDLTKPSTTPLN